MLAVKSGPEIVLPYRFNTANVWHMILKGAFALNALLIFSIVAVVFTHPLPDAIGLTVVEAMALWFTRLLFKYQEGSIGTLYSDRVDVSRNIVLGRLLSGPSGSYPLDRFSAINVEFRTGPTQPGVQGGPNEVVWLKGNSGTPNIALAHVDGGEGRALGEQLAAILKLPLEESGAPTKIRLQFG